MTGLPSQSHWYLAAYGNQVSSDALTKLKILNINLVLYRDQKGKARATLDSCPHKKLPLSMGTLADGILKCRYHGWEFKEGQLAKVPCKGDKEVIGAFQLPSFAVVEKDNLVWVWMDRDSEPTDQPRDYPKDHKPYWFQFENIMQAPMDLILENGLDCSHTGFAHEGLFRSQPSSEVQAVVAKTKTGLKVQTLGESNGSNKNVLSLLTQGNEIYHTDEFLAPHTVYVDYRIGKSQITTLLVCTPIDEKTTRVFTRMSSLFPMLNTPIGYFLKKVTEKVIRQDKDILEGQAQNVALGDRKGFRLTQADGPSTFFFKAFDQACSGEPLWGGQYDSKTFRYKL